MSKTNFESVQEALKSIPKAEVKTPSIPVSVYVQEAEDQYVWATQDRQVLENHGLPVEYLDTLQDRTGALRYAESQWKTEYKTREQIEQELMEKSPEAVALRDRLLDAFRYAFRKRPDLLARVALIAEGGSRDDLIQDLSDEALLGRENTPLLEKINFDLARLDTAAETSDYMANLLAGTRAERQGPNVEIDLRNRAYTYLKEAVDEIRACGKYAFSENPERLKGYRSEYLRKYRSGNNDTNALGN